MKTIKIAEAPNHVIDWLVAKAEGHQWRCPWMLQSDGYLAWVSYEEGWGNPTPKYTTDPLAAWSIIDREKMKICPSESVEGPWYASKVFSFTGMHHGPTGLVAAMRCYCVFKYGEETEVPEELLA